jgi:DNA-binding NtrC family response regulator
MWQIIHSLFGSKAPGRTSLSSRVSVVGLVVSEQDRSVLKSVSAQESMDVRFVESCDQAVAAAKELTAPVILFDRDWPETEWRTAIERLAASPHGACVILLSPVADNYLWQELIRRGGYDVLAKPLRTDEVARALKLALSHWRAIASQPHRVRVVGW